MTDTDCPVCYRAEATRWEKILDRFDRPSGAVAAIVSAATTYRILLGVPERSWYDTHREDYARTGDERDLRRMLRHVTP